MPLAFQQHCNVIKYPHRLKCWLPSPLLSSPNKLKRNPLLKRTVSHPVPKAAISEMSGSLFPTCLTLLFGAYVTGIVPLFLSKNQKNERIQAVSGVVSDKLRLKHKTGFSFFLLLIYGFSHPADSEHVEHWVTSWKRAGSGLARGLQYTCRGKRTELSVRVCPLIHIHILHYSCALPITMMVQLIVMIFALITVIRLAGRRRKWDPG